MNASSGFSFSTRSLGRRSLLPLLAGLLLAVPIRGERDADSPRRVLEISAPSAGDALYARQAALILPNWRGLLERDMEIVTREGAPAFGVRLIGKDGGEKLAATAPVTMTEVFALIDTMPMRRAEMKNARRRE